MKLKMVLAPKNEAAIAGVDGAIDKNPAIVNAFAPRSVELMRCFPGRANGLDVILAASFKKATIDPVKVIPPITTPRYAVTRWRLDRCAVSCRTLPMLVKTAESPTIEWSKATVWGSSVAVTRLPTREPTSPPMAATPANWTMTSGGNPTATREVRTPDPTPRIPSALPCRAVVCDPRPEREPVN